MVGGGLVRVAVVVGVQIAVVKEGVKVVVVDGIVAVIGVDGISGAKGEIMEVAIRHGGLVTPPNISRGRDCSPRGSGGLPLPCRVISLYEPPAPRWGAETPPPPPVRFLA